MKMKICENSEKFCLKILLAYYLAVLWNYWTGSRIYL